MSVNSNNFFVTGYNVQRKWKNLRDCFRKEINLQKSSKSGDGRTKRRKYLYFEQLMFLMPSMESRDTSGNYSPPQSHDTGDEEQDDSVSQPATVTAIASSHQPSTSGTSASHRGQTKKRKYPTYEESLLHIISQKNEDVDEDKSFLMSLLPSFKKLSPQQKLTTKVEYLQVLNRVMFAAENTSPVQTQPRFVYSSVQPPHGYQHAPLQSLSYTNNSLQHAPQSTYRPVCEVIQADPSPSNSIPSVSTYVPSFSRHQDLADSPAVFATENERNLSPADSELLVLQ